MDPVQTGVRIVIGRALVEAFDLFRYEWNKDTGRYVPQLPLCHESLIHEVIDYVTKQAANVMFKWGRKVEELKGEGNKSLAEDCQEQLDKFKVTLSHISYSFLAQHLLNTLSTFKVGKNWNSAGAAVGASVCQLAAALSALDNASKGSLVDINFPQVIPQGRVETGSKYGHSHVSYIEYMTAAMEPHPGIRGDELYMDPVMFRRDHHDQSVRKIFDEVLVGTKDTPALRPTRSHTHNFNLTYRGARLVDGECKLTAKTEDESVLVLHSADQLAYKDTALAILSTNTCFRFFSSRKNIAGRKVLTSVCETKKFKLGSVTDISVDSDEGTEWLCPTSFSHYRQWQKHCVRGGGQAHSGDLVRTEVGGQKFRLCLGSIFRLVSPSCNGHED